MRSCPTWAMGNVLGVPGGKAILGHTGESDHFDHNLVIHDDDMMLPADDYNENDEDGDF